MPVEWNRAVRTCARRHRSCIQSVNLDDEREMDAFFDQIIDAGFSASAPKRRTAAQGFLSEAGHVLLKELPQDMKEASERDSAGNTGQAHGDRRRSSQRGKVLKSDSTVIGKRFEQPLADGYHHLFRPGLPAGSDRAGSGSHQ